VHFGNESSSNKVQFDLSVFLSLNVLFSASFLSCSRHAFFQAILALNNVQRLADAV